VKLSDRLRSRETELPPPQRPTTFDLAPPPSARRRQVDAMDTFKTKVHEALFERLGNRLFDAAMTADQLQSLVAQEIGTVMASTTAPLSPEERYQLAQSIVFDVVGLGPIEALLADPEVDEIMVNGLEYIYVERHGIIEQTPSRFLSDDHLRRVIDRIVSQVGRRIDESSPMVDARLVDGSRVNAIIPPLAVDGPSLTIRKFARDPLGVADLIRLGTLTEETAELLANCVRGGLNVLVSGGTGTGKTTLLNVLSSFIPGDERIVTIEDAVELQLHQEHVVRLESRPANIEGRGEVTIRDLVRNSLRMRPDRIVVGEVRGAEALDMLQAMNTGHDGSISTVHANSPRDALSRVETMVLMAGFDLPSRAIREQIASALDVIVHLQRMRDGSRRVTQIAEVVGLEGDVVTLSDVFAFDHMATTPDGRRVGRLRATGIRPVFSERLADVGVVLRPELFGDAMLLGAARR
jgi:pilus assembly protein CpaF